MRRQRCDQRISFLPKPAGPWESQVLPPLMERRKHHSQQLERLGNPGNMIQGCVVNHQSPGSMQRHVRRRHHVETVLHREENGSRQLSVDHFITGDFTYQFVLKDLQPLRLVTKPGCKQLMGTHVKKRIGGRVLVRKTVRHWKTSARLAVMKKSRRRSKPNAALA